MCSWHMWQHATSTRLTLEKLAVEKATKQPRGTAETITTSNVPGANILAMGAVILGYLRAENPIAKSSEASHSLAYGQKYALI